MILVVALSQEPTAFDGPDGFRDAFMRSIDEFNRYGLAAHNSRYQVPKELAVLLYGFKVAWAWFQSYFVV